MPCTKGPIYALMAKSDSLKVIGFSRIRGRHKKMLIELGKIHLTFMMLSIKCMLAGKYFVVNKLLPFEFSDL